MAFQHFHKHSAKYLLVSLILIVFSLLTFNIAPALTDLAAKVFGGTGGAKLTFESSSGELVRIDDETLSLCAREVESAAGFYQSVAGFDPFDGIEEGDRPYAHLMLLAEADAMGIVEPPEHAEQLMTDLKRALQRSVPDTTLTTADFARWLGANGLNEGRLLLRFAELARVEMVVRALRGTRVIDPERLVQLFVPKATKVGVDYAYLPFEKFEAELAAAPPADEELEAWFKALSEEVIEKDFTRGERFTLDFVLVDGDAFDPAGVPADLLAPVELTDDEYFAEAKRDPLRYFGDRTKVPASAEEVPPEAREKIRRDRLLKLCLEKLRSEFDVAVAALPALEPAAPDADDAAKEAAKAARDERIAKEAELFAEQVRRFGFETTKVVENDVAQLAELDPPKDTSLRFMVLGLAEPAASGIRTQSIVPTQERKWGYVVRKAAPTLPKEIKPFAEVKAQVLERWIDEHAQERAEAKGAELLAALLAESEAKVPAEVRAAFAKERDEAVAKADADAKLDDETKEQLRESARIAYATRIAGAAGPIGRARFGEIATSLGLDVRSIAPQRRDVSTQWYFNDRFAGAERFLLRENRFTTNPGDPSGAWLLAAAQGAVLPRVLVNEEEHEAYVAMVASRELPAVADMTRKDRDQAERELRSEWGRLDNPFMRRFLGGDAALPREPDDPVTMQALVERHKPMVRVTDFSAPSAAPYAY